MKLSRVAAALSFSVLASTASALPTVGFDPSDIEVVVGETFELTLLGSGFDATAAALVIDNVTGGQSFNLSFSQAGLELTNVEIASRWSFTTGNRAGVIDQTVGTLAGLAFGTFPATTDDTFEIATLTFKAAAVGDWSVAVESGVLAARVASVSGSAITPEYGSASVAVVPEPEMWAMMLAGMGLIGLRRKKSQ